MRHAPFKSSLTRQLVLSFSLLACIVIVRSLIAQSSVSLISRNFERAINENEVALQETARLGGLVSDMETGYRRHLLTHDQTYLDLLYGSQREFAAIMPQAQKRQTNDPEQLARLQEVTRLEQSWFNEVAQPGILSYKSIEPQDRSAINTLLLASSERDKELISNVRNSLDKFTRVEQVQATNNLNTALQTARLEEAVSWIASSLSVLLTATLGIYLSRRIRTPLVNLQSGAAALAAGHFEALPIQGRDELAQVSQSFNRMAETLAQREQALRAQTERLETLNQELTRANRLKSEFLATMSHELRTPLNSIIGFSDMLMAGVVGPMSEDQVECITFISSGGRHLLTLINGILDLSKIEAGRMELHCEAVIWADLVREVEMMTRPDALRKRLCVKQHLEDSELTSYADPVRVKQVLYNLVSNAVKFTPDSGKIDIWLHRVEGEQLLTHLPAPPDQPLQPGQWLVVSVQDTGVGIQHDDLSKLFQEFRQLDMGLARPAEGTGLGLALSKRLLELQGGHIWVRSAAGVGSIFAFALPLISVPVTQAEPRDHARFNAGQGVLVAEDDPASATGLPCTLAPQAWVERLQQQGLHAPAHVLVIADDLAHQDSFYELFTQAGYRAAIAENDEQGLLYAAERQPDLVLVALTLCSSSGTEVVQRLRGQASTRHIPVIVYASQTLSSEHNGQLHAQVEPMGTRWSRGTHV